MYLTSSLSVFAMKSVVCPCCSERLPKRRSVGEETGPVWSKRGGLDFTRIFTCLRQQTAWEATYLKFSGLYPCCSNTYNLQHLPRKNNLGLTAFVEILSMLFSKLAC
jgi:hypothetical protein